MSEQPPAETPATVPTSPAPARLAAPGGAEEGARRLAPDLPMKRPSVRPAVLGFLLVLLLLGAGFNVAASVLTGAVTPATAEGIYLYNANGTREVSKYLGVNVTSPELFWLRPSATDYQPFEGAGNNGFYGPSSPALLAEVKAYAAELGLTNVSVPVDLVTPSASGLDPDVTPQAALVQVPRVANESGLNQSMLQQLVNAQIVQPTFSWLGTPYVNVVLLDLALLPELPHPPPPVGGG